VIPTFAAGRFAATGRAIAAATVNDPHVPAVFPLPPLPRPAGFGPRLPDGMASI
jgi:hypothetical protein